MTFTPKTWNNTSAGGTPLSAAALIDLETRLAAYTDQITATSQASNYTVVLADAGTVIEGTSATAQTITIPPNSTVAFPTGTVIEVCQYGAGQITLTPGAGVTLRASGSLATRAQYSTVGLRKRTTNEWIVAGDSA